MNRRLPITRGRLLVLVVGMPLVLLFIGGLAITEVAYAGESTYHVRLSIPVRAQSVSISLDSGDLHVRQATSVMLRIGGTAMYSLVRSTVSARTTRSEITVDSRCHFVFWVCSFDYQVGIPAGAAESFSDGQGDITVTGITNSVVTASDGAGSITLTFTRVPDRVFITDALGKVKIVLPAGLTVYNVSAQAHLGQATVDVPTSRLSKHLITVTNASGSITITN